MKSVFVTFNLVKINTENLLFIPLLPPHIHQLTNICFNILLLN